MSNKYGIPINQNGAEIERVLRALFARGYVFADERVRTYEEFLKRWNYTNTQNWNRWGYIIIGTNYECKARLDAYTYIREYGISEISLEDFLKLNEL